MLAAIFAILALLVWTGIAGLIGFAIGRSAERRSHEEVDVEDFDF